MNKTLSFTQLLADQFGIVLCGYSVDGCCKSASAVEYNSTKDPYKLIAIAIANSLGSDEMYFKGEVVITTFDDDCVLRHRHFKF